MAAGPEDPFHRLAECGFVVDDQHAASCGSGNLHLINGLFDAQRSGVPVLAIAAQIPLAEIGTGYFQETARRRPPRR